MYILSERNSIANHFLAELRDLSIQQDPLRFRRNLERLGEVMAYELSKTLPFETRSVLTPLGTAHIPHLAAPPVLATILRAGLPFHQGFLNYFDRSESAFIGAFRAPHAPNEELKIELGYLSVPGLQGRTLILTDPMLATGRSLCRVAEALQAAGAAAQTYLVAAIAAPEGIAYVQQHLPGCELWIGAVDERLNEHLYIVPGLGDAGDLAFGAKL